LSSEAGGGGVVLEPAEPASLCLSSEVPSGVLASAASDDAACLSELEAAASVSTGLEDAFGSVIAAAAVVVGGDGAGTVDAFSADLGAVRAWHQPEPKPPPQAAHDSEGKP